MSEEVNITCGRCAEKIIIEESKLELVGNALRAQCENCGKTQIISKEVLGEERYKKIRDQLSDKKEDKKREEEEQARQKEEEQVYKSTNPREIMFEVARSPLLSLSPKQVGELQDLAEDYEGTLSPDIFRRIIANFQGVNKEQAEFAKERYWIKLQKARERMSVAQAEKMGLLSHGTPNSSGLYQSGTGDLGEQVKRGIAEGIKEGRKGLNVDSDVLSKPLGEALSNMAQTTGLINRFLNRVVITAFEEEAKSNPLFRKQIVDKAGFFMSIAKGKSEGEEGQRKDESEGEGGEREEVEEGWERKEGGGKEKNMFGKLDKYFEEEEEV